MGRNRWGFDRNRRHYGNLRNFRGFDADGIHTNTSRYDDGGFDIDELHRNGTLFDDRGFDRKQRNRNGSNRDDYGFSFHGFQPNYRRENARGFNAQRRHSNGTLFDNDGFDIDGVHQNGTDRSDRGFTAAGEHSNGTLYDDRGFNLARRHRNGTPRDNYGFNFEGAYRFGGRRDPRGFDCNGLQADGSSHDANGFDRDERHRNGTMFSDAGFDINGFSIDGFDANDFNENGQHITGHRVRGLAETIPGTVQVADINGNLSYQARSYSSFGLDQLGFYKELHYSPLGRDERFDRHGYNAANLNYLGIHKNDFERQNDPLDPDSGIVGNDAILALPAVMAYPDDMDTLIQRFNNKCYQLKMLDGIDYDLHDVDTLATFYSHLPGHDDANLRNDNPLAAFLNGRLVEANINDPSNVSIWNELKTHLKKSIYFCEYVLFPAGGLTKAQATNFAALNLNSGNDNRFLGDKINDISYKTHFNLMPRMDDYRDRVKAVITDDILNLAFYTDERDAARNLNLVHKQQDIERFFDHYETAGYLDPEKSRLYLRILADKVPTMTQDAKMVMASLFLHGGQHCPDAKRSALHQSFITNAFEESEAMRAARGKITGTGGFESMIKPKMHKLKSKFYSEWIRASLEMRRDVALHRGNIWPWSVPDMESGFSSIWNKKSDRFGLEKLANFYDLGDPIPYAAFFQAKLNRVPADFDTALSLAEVYRTGEFTKERVYYELYPKTKPHDVVMNLTDIPLLVDIKNKIFGPLWELMERSSINTGAAGQNPQDHLIMKALLLRLGILIP